MPPTTTLPPGSLDVSAFSPLCRRNAPYISYSIVPVGFTPERATVTMTIRAANGTVVATHQIEELTGTMLWPGATVDADGRPTDWPGWKLADDGVSWIPDPADRHLRDALSIEVSVGTATATATVAYPVETEACLGPDSSPPPPTAPATPITPTTAPSSATLTSDLPSTGSSGLVTLLAVGAVCVLLGVSARRIGRT
jgi:hypothetical protein